MPLGLPRTCGPGRPSPSPAERLHRPPPGQERRRVVCLRKRGRAREVEYHERNASRGPPPCPVQPRHARSLDLPRSTANTPSTDACSERFSSASRSRPERVREGVTCFTARPAVYLSSSPTHSRSPLTEDRFARSWSFEDVLVLVHNLQSTDGLVHPPSRSGLSPPTLPGSNPALW